jgi:hypothetical protein
LSPALQTVLLALISLVPRATSYPQVTTILIVQAELTIRAHIHCCPALPTVSETIIHPAIIAKLANFTTKQAVHVIWFLPAFTIRTMAITCIIIVAVFIHARQWAPPSASRRALQALLLSFQLPSQHYFRRLNQPQFLHRCPALFQHLVPLQFQVNCPQEFRVRARPRLQLHLRR